MQTWPACLVKWSTRIIYNLTRYFCLSYMKKSVQCNTAFGLTFYLNNAWSNGTNIAAHVLRNTGWRCTWARRNAVSSTLVTLWDCWTLMSSLHSSTSVTWASEWVLVTQTTSISLIDLSLTHSSSRTDFYSPQPTTQVCLLHSVQYSRGRGFGDNYIQYIIWDSKALLSCWTFVFTCYFICTACTCLCSQINDDDDDDDDSTLMIVT